MFGKTLTALLFLMRYVNVAGANVTCNETEYLHSDTCQPCSECQNGLVQWLPCSETKDTVCGPKLLFLNNEPTDKVYKSDSDLQMETRVKNDKWDEVEKISFAVLGSLVFILLTVVVILCRMHWIRNKKTKTRVIEEHYTIHDISGKCNILIRFVCSNDKT